MYKKLIIVGVIAFLAGIFVASLHSHALKSSAQFAGVTGGASGGRSIDPYFACRTKHGYMWWWYCD